MQTWDTVAIVGVGLIGGSVGLALRHRGLARDVVGIGRSAASLREAERLGAVTRTTSDLAEGVHAAGLTIVCTPVGAICETVRQVAAHCPEGALVTDTGSTKAEIVETLGTDLGRGVRFLGSHPIAGSHERGPTAARADLFIDRAVVVTPRADSRPEDRQAVGDLWRGLGARVLEMSAAEHDQALAGTSHLPHLIAAALARAVPRELHPLAGGGLRDTTRIAAGDGALWAQILLSNRQPVLGWLATFSDSVTTFRQALSEGDAAELERLLMEAKRQRDALGS